MKLSKAQRAALEWLARGDDPFRRYGRNRPNCGTEATRRVLLRLGLIETAHAGLDGLLDVDPATDVVLLTDAGRAALRASRSTSPRDLPVPPSPPTPRGPDLGSARPIQPPRKPGKRRK